MIVSQKYINLYILRGVEYAGQKLFDKLIEFFMIASPLH